MVFCQNCRRNIEESKYILHERCCKFNIKYCNECKEGIPIDEYEEHLNEHKSKFLNKKRSNEEKKDKSDKVNNDKDNNMKVECEYCQIRLTFDLIAEHVAMCGARTMNCGICGKTIIMKKMQRHLQKVHKIKDDEIHRKKLDEFCKEDVAKGGLKSNGTLTKSEINELMSMSEDEQLARALAMSENENTNITDFSSYYNNNNDKCNENENVNGSNNTNNNNNHDEIDLNDVDQEYEQILYEQELKFYEQGGM